jgi:20S proteasome alpha/beta subunit
MCAIAASDRQITAGDVEYEPNQQKIAPITPRAIILIAGNYSVHSEAIMRTHKQINDNKDVLPENIALVYGQSIQAIKRRQAEDLYLSPLGLNTDSFLARQREFSADFVERITTQIQSYEGEDARALIVAGDGQNVHIYTVDKTGMISCLDDVGFAAIGAGAWHANSRFMQFSYNNKIVLAPAAAAVFAAKKAAEVAPGVGTSTDLYIVFKDSVEPIRKDLLDRLHELYGDYIKSRLELETKIMTGLQSFIDDLRKSSKTDQEAVAKAHEPGTKPEAPRAP